MFSVQVSHKMIVSNLFQLERDVILLEPKLYGVADDVQLLKYNSFHICNYIFLHVSYRQNYTF